MSRGQGNAFVLRELIADRRRGGTNQGEKEGSCEDFEASFLSGLKVKKGKDEAFKGLGHNQKGKKGGFTYMRGL